MSAFRCVVLILMSCIMACSTVVGQVAGFVENKGQWPKQVLYAAEIPGGKLFVERDRLTYHLVDRGIKHGQSSPQEPKLKGHAYQVLLNNDAELVQHVGEQVAEAPINFLQGSNPDRWVKNVKTFADVKLYNVYPGIDMVLHAADGIKYDFLVSPQANLQDIRLTYNYVDAVQLVNNELVVFTSVDTIFEKTPVSWYAENPKNKFDLGYQLVGNQLFFEIDDRYKKQGNLVIDPELIFASYSGSTADNFGFTATYDEQGNVLTANSVYGVGYPITFGAYDATFNSSPSPNTTDIVCQKFSKDGSKLLYSTYIGGVSDDAPHSTIADEEGNLYVFGSTSSSNFPTLATAYQPKFNGGTPIGINQFRGLADYYNNGSDIILFKLSPDGSTLMSSTYLGGSGNEGLNMLLKQNYADEIRGEIEITPEGDVIIVSTSTSANYPVTENAYMKSKSGLYSGVISVLSNDLSKLKYSTFLGGTGNDAIFSLDFTKEGIVVGGGTTSNNLPVFASSFQTIRNGGIDGFVATFSSDLSTLTGLTYLGGSEYDQVYFVDTDVDGNIFANGQSLSKNYFHKHPGGYSDPSSGQFIAKLNSALTAQFFASTYGNGDGLLNLSPVGFSVDVCNQIYTVGWGGAVNKDYYDNTSYTSRLPIKDQPEGDKPWFDPISEDSSDMHIAIFDIDMSQLLYGSYLGDPMAHEHVDGGTSRFDKFGNLYLSICGGCGGHSGFPTGNDSVYAPQNGNTKNGGKCNNIAVRFNMNSTILAVNLNGDLNICEGDSIRIFSVRQNAEDYEWKVNGEVVNADTGYFAFMPDSVGEYVVEQTVRNLNSCNQTAHDQLTINVYPTEPDSLPELTICIGDSSALGLDSAQFATFTNIEWEDANGTFLSNELNPSVLLSDTSVFQLTLTYPGGCKSTYKQVVNVLNLDVLPLTDSTFCDTTNFIDLHPSVAKPSYSYAWYTDPNFTSPINASPKDSVLRVYPQSKNEMYYLTVTSGACTFVDSIALIYSPLTATVQGEVIFCANDSVIQVSVQGEAGNLYNWDYSPAIIGNLDTNRVAVRTDSNHTLTVNITSPLGCLEKREIDVVLSSIFNSSTSIEAPDTIGILNEDLTAGVYFTGSYNFTYEWQPSGIITSTANNLITFSITQDTTISVIIRDGDCVTEISKRFYFKEVKCGEDDVYLPNAFTPNGDNKNDVLFVRENNMKELSFKLFDRLGNLIFSTTDSAIGWDGTFEGEPLKPAVFVYILKGLCLTKEPFYQQGNVTLIR